MQYRYQILHVVVGACLSLLCACKSPGKPSVSEPQVVGRLSVAHDGYVKGEADVWNAVFVVRNLTEAPIEYLISSYPRATGEIPQGTQSIGAVGLSMEDLPKHLRWAAGKPQADITLMKRYGLGQTKVLAAQQSERIFFPLYVTPSHPGKTRNQLLIAIRQSSDQDGAETYDSYIAELVL